MTYLTTLLTVTLLYSIAFPGIPRITVKAEQEQNSPQHRLFQKIINGKDNPSQITDLVAYELFFRSLIFRPEESALGQSRLRALAEEMALTTAEGDILRAAAENFTKRMVSLENRVAEVKDKHLPNLSSEDINELVGLRKHKESIIKSAVVTLPATLGRRLASKVHTHINARVKQRVRSVQPLIPNHQHEVTIENQPRGVRFSRAKFIAKPQYDGIGMNGMGHLYIDEWVDTAAGYVYARSNITEDPNM